MLYAVLIELQFGEEGLIQAPTPALVGFRVQPVAVSEKPQGSIQAFFDEAGVDLRDVQQSLGLGNLGVERDVTLLEVGQTNCTVQVSVDQLLPTLLEALPTAGLGRDELADGRLMLGHLSLHGIAGKRYQLGMDAQRAPVPTDMILDLGHAQMRQVAGCALGVPTQTEEVGIESTAPSARNSEAESRAAARTEQASLQEMVVSPGAITGCASA